MGGVPLHLFSKVLDHKDTSMVDRVYGQLPEFALKAALQNHLKPAALFSKHETPISDLPFTGSVTCSV